MDRSIKNVRQFERVFQPYRMSEELKKRKTLKITEASKTIKPSL
jgi:hypothetical protein